VGAFQLDLRNDTFFQNRSAICVIAFRTTWPLIRSADWKME